MSFGRTYHAHGGTFHAQGGTFHDSYKSSFNRNIKTSNYCSKNSVNIDENRVRNYNDVHDYTWNSREQKNNLNYVNSSAGPSLKRRKFSSSAWEGCGSHYQLLNPCDGDTSTSDSTFPTSRGVDANSYNSTSCKRDRSELNDDDEVVFMSRYEIERCSPSRKDGIDALRETHLRYSYCAFIQNLGLRLDLPQTTIGTAMVLCHRFFVRRSHACHDRFLIATAALFLAAKSEETPRPLNNVSRASCEILYKQDLTFLSYLLPVGWFEQYRERLLEAEQMILTTLNFELNVQHPYAPLTSILNKLGLSESVLVTLALNLVSEGLRSSLWLQFKPPQIAAGAAYLAAKFLNWDLASCHNIWEEFQTTPAILQDVVQQLMELF